jgi:anti-anti-sigma regulatory factor
MRPRPLRWRLSTNSCPAKVLDDILVDISGLSRLDKAGYHALEALLERAGERRARLTIIGGRG